MARKKELDCIRNAASKVENFLAATRGDDSRCATFRGGHPFCEPFTERQLEQVRIYVETWIQTPLMAALAGIDGDRSWDNESTLDSFARKPW